MMMNKTSHWVTALLALTLAACATEPTESNTDVGRLDVPLVSTGSNGAQFALVGTFDLVGPETINTVVTFNAASASPDALVLNPRVGAYNLALTNWSLYSVTLDAAGNISGGNVVSNPTLLSAATVAITIQNNQTTSTIYQFSVPGAGTIVFARGTLNVDFTVDQGFPAGAACTQDVECASQVCAAAGVCMAASCTDGVQNGTETSPDCGPQCMCGGGAMMCTAAEAAQCAVSCFINAAGVAQCSTGSAFPPAGSMCTAAETQMCAAGSTSCVANGMGGIVCGSAPVVGNVGDVCDPTLNPVNCAAGLSCVGNAAAGYTCQALLPAGAACNQNAQCASQLCFAATGTCG